MKFYITGTRRGLGKALVEKYGNCGSLDQCDVFINCKHDQFNQINLLYEAASLNKRIINIGSCSPDTYKSEPHIYAVQKKALDTANEQLFYQGTATTVIRFGLLDTERVKDINKPKINLNDAIDIISWVLSSKYLIKDITIKP